MSRHYKPGTVIPSETGPDRWTFTFFEDDMEVIGEIELMGETQATAADAKAVMRDLVDEYNADLDC